MNHKLCRELRKAGFPQERREQYDPDYIYADGTIDPTLHELIEACGYNFEALLHHPAESGLEWQASAISLPSVYGNTPEEAVARLYIALNKK